MVSGLRLSLVVLCSLCLSTYSIAASNGPGNDLAQIDFQGYVLDGDKVRFNYELPFGGMVEIYLYNANGEKVWYHHYVNEEGKNSIALRAAAFRPGQSYRYVLKYKLSEVSGELPAGFSTSVL